MFDHHHHGPREMRVTETRTVSEHRATTDESVSLLREMEKAAQDSVVAIIKNNSNSFEFSTHVFQDDANPFNPQSLRCRFILNGEKYDFTVHPTETCKSAPEFFAATLKAVSDKIASVVLIDLAKNNARFFSSRGFQ